MDELVVDESAGEVSTTLPERSVVLEKLADVSGSGSRDGEGESSSLEVSVLPDLVDTKMWRLCSGVSG